MKAYLLKFTCCRFDFLLRLDDTSKGCFGLKNHAVFIYGFETEWFIEGFSIRVWIWFWGIFKAFDPDFFYLAPSFTLWFFTFSFRWFCPWDFAVFTPEIIEWSTIAMEYSFKKGFLLLVLRLPRSFDGLLSLPDPVVLRLELIWVFPFGNWFVLFMLNLNFNKFQKENDPKLKCYKANANLA